MEIKISLRECSDWAGSIHYLSCISQHEAPLKAVLSFYCPCPVFLRGKKKRENGDPSMGEMKKNEIASFKPQCTVFHMNSREDQMIFDLFPGSSSSFQDCLRTPGHLLLLF